MGWQRHAATAAGKEMTNSSSFIPERRRRVDRN
jgi:hypothetical protein